MKISDLETNVGDLKVDKFPFNCPYCGKLQADNKEQLNKITLHICKEEK